MDFLSNIPIRISKDQLILVAFLFVLCAALLYIFAPAIQAAKKSNSGAGVLSQVEVLESSQLQLQPQQLIQQPLLSIIIPAYNEQDRLIVMLQAAFDYLAQKNVPALNDLDRLNRNREQTTVVEWILVSDGSNDRTEDVYRSFVKNLPNNNNSNTKLVMIWKLIAFSKNQGKGAAVQAGMLASTAAFALMVDADGATEFGPGLEALTSRLRNCTSTTSDDKKDVAVVVGSRAHLRASVGKRNPIRKLLMHGFYLCVVVLVGAAEIQDTQCGFKLFRSDAAAFLFSNLHLRRWAFDTEIISLAHREYNIEEVIVPWHEVDGSKLHTSALNLALVAISMFRDMLCVRLCYSLGIWKIKKSPARMS